MSEQQPGTEKNPNASTLPKPPPPTPMSATLILACKWDYVTQRNAKVYKEDASAIPLGERTDLCELRALIKKKLSNSESGSKDNPNWSLLGSLADADIKKYAKERYKEKLPNEPNYDPQKDWDNGLAYSVALTKGSDSDTPLYGESLFFTEGVRKVIYNSVPNDPSPLVCIYELYNKGQTKTLYIDTGEKTYTLPIRTMMARFYTTGVMLLSIQVEWGKENSSAAEFSRVIGKVRRLFKPFIDTGSDACGETAKCTWISIESVSSENDTTKGTGEDAESVAKKQKSASSENGSAAIIPICFDCNSCFSEQVAILREQSSNLPAGHKTIFRNLFPNLPAGHKTIAHPEYLVFLEELLRGPFISRKRWLEILEKREVLPESIILTPLNDDRMFVHGYVYDAPLADTLKEAWPDRAQILTGPYVDINNVKRVIKNRERKRALYNWYGLTQLDADIDFPTCPDLETMAWQLSRDTYARWCGWGTLYGLTYNNFLMLSNAKPGTESYLYRNMMWNYQQMFLIALLQRCSILRFYDEAASIMLHKGVSKPTASLCASLRNKYIVFLNSLWWRDLTLQVQGMEMYEQLSKSMRIEENVKQLDEALEELHGYEEGCFQKRLSDVLSGLTLVGALWAGLEMAGFLFDRLFHGGSAVQNLKSWSFVCVLLGTLAGVIGICIFGVKLINRFFDRNKRH